jgi:hypothetical protein
MKKYSIEEFNQLIEKSTAKPRLKRELRFTTSTAHLSEDDWTDAELLPVTDRSGNTGVLIVALNDEIYILPAEFKHGITSATTGRAQPIICDFCKTWQSGTKAGSILFTNVNKTSNSIGYLCCGDLACSNNVRTKTSASKMSRAQLREDMTNEQRIARLRKQLRLILDTLHAIPLE